MVIHLIHSLNSTSITLPSNYNIIPFVYYILCTYTCCMLTTNLALFSPILVDQTKCDERLMVLHVWYVTQTIVKGWCNSMISKANSLSQLLVLILSLYTCWWTLSNDTIICKGSIQHTQDNLSFDQTNRSEASYLTESTGFIFIWFTH
jgi:hypothetical protein